jgi:hypothetical protein
VTITDINTARTRTVVTVAPLQLASEDSHTSVVMVPIIHLTRTTPIVAGWRHVTGVPARRPTQALTLYERPQNRSAQPSNGSESGYSAGATLAPCCGFRAPQERDGGVRR